MMDVKGKWEGQSDWMRERRMSMEVRIDVGEASGMGMKCRRRWGRDYAAMARVLPWGSAGKGGDRDRSHGYSPAWA